MKNSINLIRDNNGLISGCDEFDKVLLAHVSNNSESITEKLFCKNVSPLLGLHGITSLCILHTPEPSLESIKINIVKND
jgi:hypothetical protein